MKDKVVREWYDELRSRIDRLCKEVECIQHTLHEAELEKAGWTLVLEDVAVWYPSNTTTAQVRNWKPPRNSKLKQGSYSKEDALRLNKDLV